jgi:hypothetical protein
MVLSSNIQFDSYLFNYNFIMMNCKTHFSLQTFLDHIRKVNQRHFRPLLLRAQPLLARKGFFLR